MKMFLHKRCPTSMMHHASDAFPNPQRALKAVFALRRCNIISHLVSLKIVTNPLRETPGQDSVPSLGRTTRIRSALIEQFDRCEYHAQ